jgi:hypothetical protein
MRGPRDSIRDAMKPTYDQILDIMHQTMNEVTVAGHDVSKCVWELSPSIYRTITDHWCHTCPEMRACKGGQDAFMGIPIRQGVTDEGAGILLKQVNLNLNE